jgi:hypothetical protein
VRAGPWWRRWQAAVRVGLATLLGAQALTLLILGRGQFARLGYPDQARVALGVLELVAAILTIVPRTFYIGAIGLIAVLAWAAGFHYGLHRGSWLLLVYIAALALLLAARTRGERRNQSAA